MQRSTFVAAVVAVVLACAATAANARTLRLDNDGLTAWLPDQWKIESNESLTTALAPNGEASAVFVSAPIRDLDLAYKNLPVLVKTILPGMQYGQPRRVAVANLSAIQIGAYADVVNGSGTTKIEANIVVLITPGQRALYLITLVHAESASAFDAAIGKILTGVAQATAVAAPAAPEQAKPQAPKENPCWELKGQPNGWTKQSWNGVSFLLPRGWSAAEGKNPSTDEPYLQLGNTDDRSTILVFTYAAARPDTAWQALAPQLESYGLGDVAWGDVVGQRALCAKGSASDGVLFHRGSKALVMLGRAASDPSAMRGILGSMRWK